MTSLVEVRTAREASEGFSWARLWELFDGTSAQLNITHECIDRHDPDGTAARIAFADGTYDEICFGELKRSTARFAQWLVERGVGPGQPVGVMLEPSRGFYTAVFGIIKRGAVAVPLYTLFGPQAVRDRVIDCGAVLVVVDASRVPAVKDLGVPYVVYDPALEEQLEALSGSFSPTTAADDLAVLQYTSGTTRELPEAVRHDHRSVVTLARAGLFALGLKPGDRYFCPSSPAWGHGLWHGTIAPWSLGIALGAYSGRFSADRLVDALVELEIDNLAAASTVYRMLTRSRRVAELSTLRKASYTGEELDPATQDRFREQVGVAVCGMYGTTETGVILVNFPGFPDHEPRPGALGRPMPGCDVTVLDDAGEPTPPGQRGEISVRRRGQWFRVKDLGWLDEAGYFHYGGRADDVIISAGWTISPLEVERSLLTHPAVQECAVVGAPDALRGNVVRAVLVTDRQPSPELTEELQKFVKDQLSPHEYPRVIDYADSLPKTPNGKIDRRSLRGRTA